jgi:ATP-dependent protease ClpP protease subunit
MNPLHVFGEVDENLANALFEQLPADLDIGRPLKISSMGGDLGMGLAVYDELKKREPTIIATGIVGSAASLIYLAGKVRLATPNTLFIIHEPWFETDSERDQKEAEKWLPYLSQTIKGLFTQVMGDDYERALLVGVFGVDDAIRWGLTHRVTEE